MHLVAQAQSSPSTTQIIFPSKNGAVTVGQSFPSGSQPTVPKDICRHYHLERQTIEFPLHYRWTPHHSVLHACSLASASTRDLCRLGWKCLYRTKSIPILVMWWEQQVVDAIRSLQGATTQHPSRLLRKVWWLQHKSLSAQNVTPWRIYRGLKLEPPRFIAGQQLSAATPKELGHGSYQPNWLGFAIRW